MSCLGVHFAITQDQADSLWSHFDEDEDDGVVAVVEAIEEAWDEAHLQQTDKAWDAIHRCLSDGTLTPGAGEWPLIGAVLGGECLYFKDDYIVRLLEAEQVIEVANALELVTREWFATRFSRLRQHGYAGTADDFDFEYTWDWFEELRRFFTREAIEGRAVLFTADQ